MAIALWVFTDWFSLFWAEWVSLAIVAVHFILDSGDLVGLPSTAARRNSQTRAANLKGAKSAFGHAGAVARLGVACPERQDAPDSRFCLRQRVLGRVRILRGGGAGRRRALKVGRFRGAAALPPMMASGQSGC